MVAFSSKTLLALLIATAAAKNVINPQPPQDSIDSAPQEITFDVIQDFDSTPLGHPSLEGLALPRAKRDEGNPKSQSGSERPKIGDAYGAAGPAIDSYLESEAGKSTIPARDIAPDAPLTKRQDGTVCDTPDPNDPTRLSSACQQIQDQLEVEIAASAGTSKSSGKTQANTGDLDTNPGLTGEANALDQLSKTGISGGASDITGTAAKDSNEAATQKAATDLAGQPGPGTAFPGAHKTRSVPRIHAREFAL